MASRVLIVAALALLGAQLVPVGRSNPAVESEIPTTEAVRPILRRACYDCHSHETRWPWYAYVAPVSWAVSHDVEHAREHMNFSTWGIYTPEEQQDHLEEILEEVDEGHMPPAAYVWMHAGAQLREGDVEQLRNWVHVLETRPVPDPAPER